MTHRFVSPEQRAILGITDSFLRLSIGLENADDLINDMNQALLKAVRFTNIFTLEIFYFIIILFFKLLSNRYQLFENNK